MKNVKLLGVIAVCLLSTSVFVTIPAFSAQPPLSATTYYVGSIGQPSRMDSARAYDTASGELLQNIYQTLIWWSNKPVVNFTAGVGHNLTISEYADLSSYTPVLATSVPANGSGIVYNSSGSYWTFTINTNAVFQPWINGSGALQPSRNLTAADVVYSFQRQMVYDSPYAPTWMWFASAFGTMGFSAEYDGGPYSTYNNGTFMNTTDEIAAGINITSWVYPGPGPNDVTFHFQQPWAEGALKQIFAQTWGSIVNKDWVIAHGGWDGSFYPGWTNDYHWKPTRQRSELDAYKDPAIYGAAHGSTYPSFSYSACGTGPYNFTSWDTVNKRWRIDANPNYWLGWSNAGDKAGNYIHAVIEQGIDAWPTRKMLFLNGEFDVAVVPRANMYDLLTGNKYNPIAGINLVYNVASPSNDVLLFTMDVSGAYPYQSYVGAPTHLTGAEPYFFNNTHMRRAFAWALNYTDYIHAAWFDEAIWQNTWWVDGLAPASYKNTALPYRTLDYAMIKSELDQAIIDGYNISQTGFETTIAYNIGNDQRMISMNLIASAFATLGSKYKVNVVGLDWPVYLDAMYAGGLAIYDVGWLADFADPDNFCRPYQYSTGAFVVYQGALNTTAGGDRTLPSDQEFIDAEIDAAIVETNATLRGEMYWDLQERYWNDCISFPLIQPVGRRFARDWVQGWYYNSLYPGLYAYDIYKSAPTTYQPVDVEVTAITPITAYPWVYISSGQMKQLYGGGAPATMTFQVHVKRNDANTNVALLTVAVSLERFNLTALSAAVPVVNPSTPAYPASTIVLLAPGGEWTGMLTWYEDGKVSTCQANATWEIAAFVAVVGPNAEDNNTANNFADSGFNSIVLTCWNATTGNYYLMPGDINVDGIVNILDSIAFMNCFGKGLGQLGYNQAADLNRDGIVDILDAILFSYHLGQKIGSDP